MLKSLASMSLLSFRGCRVIYMHGERVLVKYEATSRFEWVILSAHLISYAMIHRAKTYCRRLLRDTFADLRVRFMQLYQRDAMLHHYTKVGKTGAGGASLTSVFAHRPIICPVNAHDDVFSSVRVVQ